MEQRINVKQYIDMDDLSMPWKNENKLVTPLNNGVVANTKNIIEYLKNIKYEYKMSNEKGLKLVKNK